uniref:Uncharacterized protein n=1 Tax=Utricularia reniformis TaxID=192314 RepID=A0A1Y0B1L0_9LAMI|nr:hypothetical protein AEK19_MT1048 [Utricularia reniformis]ART31271.1 hypothetical protein AEK19_MT1048 [Utricularia reniformis]
MRGDLTKIINKYYIPIERYTKNQNTAITNNVNQLAKIKPTHSTLLHQRLNIPIKSQARRMFAYPALPSCSLLLTYET